MTPKDLHWKQKDLDDIINVYRAVSKYPAGKTWIFKDEADDAECHDIYITGLTNEEYLNVISSAHVSEIPDEGVCIGVHVLNWPEDAVDDSMIEFREV